MKDQVAEVHLNPQKQHQTIYKVSRTPCCTPVILALWKLRQEDHKFPASVSYIVRLCLKCVYVHISYAYMYIHIYCNEVIPSKF
jgi:hypothetical protein